MPSLDHRLKQLSPTITTGLVRACIRVKIITKAFLQPMSAPQQNIQSFFGDWHTIRSLQRTYIWENTPIGPKKLWIIFQIFRMEVLCWLRWFTATLAQVVSSWHSSLPVASAETPCWFESLSSLTKHNLAMRCQQMNSTKVISELDEMS